MNWKELDRESAVVSAMVSVGPTRSLSKTWLGSSGYRSLWHRPLMSGRMRGVDSGEDESCEDGPFADGPFADRLLRFEGAGWEWTVRFREMVAAFEEDAFSEPMLEKRSVCLMDRLMLEPSVAPVSSPMLKRSRRGASGDDWASSSSVSCGVT